MLIGYVIRGGMLTNFYRGNQILLFLFFYLKSVVFTGLISLLLNVFTVNFVFVACYIDIFWFYLNGTKRVLEMPLRT